MKVLLVVVLVLGITVFSHAQSEMAAGGSLPTVLGQLDLNTMGLILQAVDGEVVRRLQNEGPFTVFAPTDAAFYTMGQDQFAQTIGDTNLITPILMYHIVPGYYPLASLYDGQLLRTMQGEDLRISRRGGQVYVNQALVTSSDHATANGLVHTVDAVLLPPSTGNQPEVKIPELAVRLGLNQLNSALNIADYGITTILRGRGPFTLFAPSDAAFAALPETTIAALRRNPLDLRQVLLYHVAPGFYNASMIRNGDSLATLHGERLAVTKNGELITLNGNATVNSVNNRASNGLIHIIDRVLIPASLQTKYPIA